MFCYCSDTSLLVSTLSGALYALDSKTGDILWKLMDEPVVKSPYNPEKPVMPAFLPGIDRLNLPQITNRNISSIKG